MIDEFAKLIPRILMEKSGAVFYSGRAGFTSQHSLYLLGVNPGGDAAARPSETVRRHTDVVLTEKPENWSEYRDESWLGAAPGTWRMQPRVCHLLSALGLDPGEVPASNLVFQRSTRESVIDGNMLELSGLCWPFHQAVIDRLKIRTVVCFGKTAGNFVRKQLRANQLMSEFIEKNERRWKSRLFINGTGLTVIEATHPSIADWTAPATDPTELVRKALASRAQMTDKSAFMSKP